MTQVAQAAGVITATMASSGVAKGVEGLTLILSPVTNNGSLSWKCKGSGSCCGRYCEVLPELLPLISERKLQTARFCGQFSLVNVVFLG